MDMNFKISSFHGNDDDCAAMLLDYIHSLIRSDKWNTSKDLYESVFNKSKMIMNKRKVKTDTSFVVLRVLKIIREECSRVICGNPELESNTTNLLFAKNEAELDTISRENLKEFLLEAVEVFSNEFKESETLIRESALAYVDNEDVIVVYGYSSSVLSLLSFVAESSRIFKVIVLESYPNTNGILMAEKLAEIGVSVSIAPERSSMTILSKADKVFIYCDTVFSDGVVLTKAGASRICMDAYTLSVPVFVYVPVSNVSPLLSLNHEDIVLCESDSNDNFLIYNDDLIPMKFISTFITNIGPLEPSRLLTVSKDNFCTEDVNALFFVSLS